MRRDNHTAILEFTVIKRSIEIETVGEILKLSFFGEYCPDRSARGYQLSFLLDNPEFYRISKIRMKGKDYTLPENLPKNYAAARAVFDRVKTKKH